MHLPVLVIDGHVLLNGGRYGGVVYDNVGTTGLGVNHKFQDIEKLTGVSAAVTHEGLGLPKFYILVLQEDILLERAVQKLLQIILPQGFEHKNLAA